MTELENDFSERLPIGVENASPEHRWPVRLDKDELITKADRDHLAGSSSKT